jgi:hypothetical protein
MTESTTIKLPRAMPLAQRIREASRQVTEWVSELEVPFDDERDRIQLVKHEQNTNEFCYHYSIIKRKDLSVSDVTIRKK